MQHQQKTRTVTLSPNSNKTFPIGTIYFVEYFYKKLGFEGIFGPLKSKGHDINAIMKLLLTYRLSEYDSIRKAAESINDSYLLERYALSPVHRQTLYLTLERLGVYADEVVKSIQEALFKTYDFPSTDINLDWTSIVLHGNAAELGKFGYSRDHRPDKMQLTVGLSELAAPINIPIGLTVREGNVMDQTHFKTTYAQVRDIVKDDSLVIFDKGASSIDNTKLVIESRKHYLTAKKLNKSDDAKIAGYWANAPVSIGMDGNIYCQEYVKPHSRSFLYFSHSLYERQLYSQKKKARAMVTEAAGLHSDLRAGKKIKKKFLGPMKKNVLIDFTTCVQTKLCEMTEKEAYKYALSRCISGREGFFCLKTDTDLTASEALLRYRKKDSIEKIFHSLKNEIKVKPVRCWKKERQIGVLMLGFIAQIFISLLRYEVQEVRHTSTKFIKKSLKNLTDTLVKRKNGEKRHVYSNFDDMNIAILRKCGVIS